MDAGHRPAGAAVAAHAAGVGGRGGRFAEEGRAAGDGGRVELVEGVGRADHGADVGVDGVPVLGAGAGAVLIGPGRAAEAVGGQGDLGFLRERAAGGAGDRGIGAGDGALAALHVAGVALEVVHLVEDAGPVEGAALLHGAAAVAAVERGRLARAGGEDPGDVVAAAIGVAGGARGPGVERETRRSTGCGISGPSCPGSSSPPGAPGTSHAAAADTERSTVTKPGLRNGPSAPSHSHSRATTPAGHESPGCAGSRRSAVDRSRQPPGPVTPRAGSAGRRSRTRRRRTGPRSRARDGRPSRRRRARRRPPDGRPGSFHRRVRRCRIRASGR